MDSDIPLTELEELQCELPEAQDDEDEVEELKNSLREVVQDQSVKPKLQCLIVDPSFSMVTVQSEDSSIIWETASSRCSTPWASDASYSSDTYSIDGSTTCGVQGKINIVFDEERIVRKRKRTRGKSRLGERLRTPRCSRSGSELGVERPEMAEVSVPNIRVECVESDTESGRGKDREQELFSLISESYEILNIKVPSKLQTVDEEESTVLQDNLHYLEETPRIKSKFRCGSQALSAQDCPILVEAPDNTDEQVVKDSQPLKPMDEQGTCIRRDGSRDMEYFEAFTLIDDLIIPGQQDTVTLLEEADTLPLLEEPYLKQKTATDTHDAALLNDFVIVTDMEIASERLDEVFYGNKRHATPNNLMDEKEDKEGAKRGRRESLKSLKESGSALFGSEESILTPIFLSPGPPKIIDPGLLEEPAAMSFLYSDLYEDAKGEKRRSDEEGSEAESVGSDRTLLGHLSDSEETDGYLEKFILKDETPSEVGRSEEADNKGEWLMLWPQTKYELTGFLTRVVEEEERESKVCNLEEVRVAVDLQPSGCEENGSELTKKCPQELHCAFDEAVTDSSTVVISKISDKTKTTEPDRPGTGFIHNLQAKVVPPAPQWPLTPSPSKEGNAKEVPLMKRNTLESEDEWENSHLRKITEMELQPEARVTEGEPHKEESQARAATALLGMDWFCLCCGCLLSETDKLSGGHKDHKITSIETAFEDIRERLSDWISDLQERSEIIENLVSELELGYNTLESSLCLYISSPVSLVLVGSSFPVRSKDHCRDSEDGMKAQNEEIVALVVEQYNTMSLCIEEEKKATLEQLYDQIISFQDSIDHAKVTLETTAREAEIDPDQDMQTTKDICMRLKKAQQSAMSLELGPQGLLVFENYAKGNTANKQMQRKGIPVPQKPSLQPQEYGSASSTSVTVYWRVSLGDIIDCFQVYCTEDPQGAVSDEYRVTVKESYCVLEELEPDKVYKVWVMAVNYTGCSLPSERLPFRTSPSVPVIDTERCTILWDSATLRWSATNQTQAESYTLEYCRQYALEGEGLRCISGIQGRQQKVLLHPNENYLFYIKAVNKAGASEQSEAALISTRGTRFQLLTRSVHPVLKLSEDQTTIHYPLDTYKQIDEEAKRYLSVLGELLPMKGHHYWETNVTGSPAYRVGVVYGTANGDSPLVENSMSWCLHCVPTPSSCRFELLHGSVQTDVFVVDVPSRIGTLLDFQNGCLSFYNAQSGQLLGTLSHCFTQPCHPILGMEQPGSLKVSMTFKMPDFIKNS
ncbi:hypothetical protein DPEC_G00259330 [Dallia pectoralis]|uniref:Uncharacterized protein n=1 Tax=Dallia pectoralis TaxID=75939 RepID=A0ACC2FRN1_DALPE|nr:hypothetical protein DPEC_G00259330 [Dallia pectoralis]